MPTTKKNTRSRKRGGARTGEAVLFTSSPLLTGETLQMVANACLGLLTQDEHGHYVRIIGVRIDPTYRIVYGTLEETVETAPYLFEPAPSVVETHEKRGELPESGTLKVHLWLRVENNTSSVRMKTRVRDWIEQRILLKYQVKKPDPAGWEYTLSIPYTSQEELTRIIQEDILIEAERIADLYNCFTEADVTALDGSGRSW